MLTSSLITFIKKDYPDWSRNYILFAINEIQNMVFTQNATKQMWIYDSSTGKDPVLTTTDSTYEYYINTDEGFPYNAWRVYDVYSSDITDPEDVEKFEAAQGSYARILFKENPGVQDFYVRAYRFPTSLTTESIALEIPAAYHLDYVYEGVCGFIEKFRSGRSERYENFVRILLPELVKKMSDSNAGIYEVTYKGY